MNYSITESHLKGFHVQASVDAKVSLKATRTPYKCFSNCF